MSKKKASKKKVTKRKAIKKRATKKQQKKYITEVELLELSLGLEKIKTANYERAVFDGKLMAMLQKTGLDKENQMTHNAIAEAKKEYTKVIRSVEERLGLEKFTGYDPDTLEVK